MKVTVPSTLQTRLLDSLTRHAARTAVRQGERELTYEQLERQSGAAARWLQANCPTGSTIGLYTEDALDRIVWMLGIMRAGCVFLPLDSGNPSRRIGEMAAEAQPAWIIGDRACLAELSGRLWDGLTASLEDMPLAVSPAPESLEAVEWRPEDNMYIYFTSGSTGRPKAVLGRNRSLLHFIDWEIDAFELDESHVFSQLTNPGFDVYLRDTLVALCCGGMLAIPERPELLLDGEALYQFIRRERITLMHCVPSLFRLLVSNGQPGDDLPDLQYVLLAGEKIMPAQLQPWYEAFGERIQLVNLYGPTETTLAKCYYRIKPEDAYRETMPVGQPIKGARVIVLDERLEVCDTLVAGEVYIRTPYRSAGYLNDPLRNAERFVRNPFSDREDDLIYRTGDLGRLLPNGMLELTGRTDRQVKIRGVRVEPEEVERKLQARQDMLECAVISEVSEETGDGSLHACVVPLGPVGDEQAWLDKLRDSCAELLPEAMVPSGWLLLEALPRLVNGKMDIRTLRERYKSARTELIGPRDDTEQRLHAIWGSLLGSPELGVTSSFYQLGGTSLHLMKLIAAISREFGIKLPLASLFKHNTIEKQAELLRSKQPRTTQPALEEAPVAEDCVMSRAQQRMYMLHELHGASTMYNLNRILEVEGDLSLDRLTRAVHAVTDRHEALRTTFHMVDESPVQRVHPKASITVETIDGQGLSAHEAAGRFVRPFALDRLPLLRVGVASLGENKHLLMLDLHHIVADAASIDILLHDLLAVYQGGQLEAVPHLYRDYARAQYSEAYMSKLEIQGAYWLKQYELEPSRIELGAGLRPQLPDQSRQDGKSTELGERMEWRLDPLVLSRLKGQAARMETTLYMIMLAAMAVLLARYSNQEDIVIGTPVLGRTEEHESSIVGLFVNTLALRLKPRAGDTFEQFMEGVKAHVIEGLDNQDYPFDALIEALQLERDGLRNPLFDVMFTFHYATAPVTLDDGLSFRSLPPVVKAAKFDLSLEIAEGEGDDVRIALEYDPSRVNKELARRMGRHYMQLLSEVDASRLLGETAMLHENDIRELASWNETSAPYPAGQRLETLFEQQAMKTPGQVAIIDDEGEYTYSQTDTLANRLATWLREQGAASGAVIGVLAERSARLPIALLAILKAGGVYLPLDPTLPASRIGWMLRDSGAAIVLTEQRFMDLQALEDYPGIVGMLEDDALYTPCSELAIRDGLASVPAYIIYTSGSTGRPKGVVVEHEAVVNRLNWMQKQYPLTPQDIILQKTVASFDVSMWELLWWGIAGASVVMLPSGEEKDPSAILSAIRRRGVTVLHFVPSMLKQWLDYIDASDGGQLPPSLRFVFSSGEALPANAAKRFYSLPGSSCARLVNLYGPTEAAIDVSFYECMPDDRREMVPIGLPIDNIRLYVVGLHDNEQPVGAPGELCIAGVGLASGYLNDPLRTADAFTDCPFEAGGRMYRTGDIVSRQPDGRLAYHGRKDEQIKIRGFRIEPGEIESRLREHPDVRDAVVIADHASQRLWAYYVPAGSVRAEEAELQELLRSQLPIYMVPAAFVPIDAIPLTASGKTNRQALPKPQLHTDNEASRTGSVPLRPAERLVASVWAAVLERHLTEADADFFHMGGHSFQAFAAALRLSREARVKIELRDMFQYSTVRRMAAYMEQLQYEQNGLAPYEPIPAVERQEYYPVTSSQRRMLVLQQLEGAPMAYNMPAAFRVSVRLEPGRLAQALRSVISRHESLRTSFHWIEGEPMQRIEAAVEAPIERIASDGRSEMEIISGFVRPFDPASAPLLRTAIAEIADQEQLLLIDMHHLISDGVSASLFIRELAEAYVGRELRAAPDIQYKDYAYWQHSRLSSSEMLVHEQYWLEQFKDSEPGVLQTDYPRPAMQSFAGARQRFALDAELSPKLRQLARSTEATLFAVLLSGYMILLSKYTGHDDVHTGVPVAGRNHPDVQETIGLFMRTLPLRSRPYSHLPIRQYVSQVRDAMLQMIEHQDYPPEQLLGLLELPRDMSRNPLFDTLFVMQNYTERKISLPGMNIAPVVLEQRTSKFDLTFELAEQAGELTLEVEYNTSLYRSDRIARMVEHYNLILQQMTAEPDKTIGWLSMLSAADYRLVTEQFNATAVPYNESATIDQLFDQAVALRPERLALRFGDISISYGELGRRVAMLAGRLGGQGAGPEQRVALLLPRSVAMVVGMLGVLKSGAAFVPIDPSFPEARIRFMLEDCGAKLMLTCEGIEAPEFAGKVIVLSREGTDEQLAWREAAAAIAAEAHCTLEKPNESPTDRESPADSEGRRLAYIMYTSGSTGTPKGVMIEHRAVHNFIVGMKEALAWEDDTVVLAATTYSFDICLLETILPFTQGLAVVLADEEEQLDMKRLCGLIASSGVNLVQLTPSRMRSLLLEASSAEALQGVRHIVLGGEPLPEPLIAHLKEATSAALYNMYGPTETTIWSSASRIREASEVTIGKPIANTRFYIADWTGTQLQGIGLPGELYIAGDGVARGYWNRPEINDERFVTAPFGLEGRAYKTGDLAAWLPDGRVVSFGRSDDQMKINGYRIEPGELEAVLVRYPGIREAAVAALQDANGQSRLHAYYTAAEELPIEPLRLFLLRHVPHYMVPAAFVQVERLPATANGKLDRRALTHIGITPGEGERTEPRDELERRLSAIWQDVLGATQPVGVYDSFFQLGGDSIKAIRLIARIAAETGGQIALMELYRQPTIAEMAGQIRSKEPSELANDPLAAALEQLETYRLRVMDSGDDRLPQDLEDVYPMSDIQLGIVYHSLLETAEPLYHDQFVFTLKTGSCDPEAMEQALYYMATKHPILRTELHMEGLGDGPVQLVRQQPVLDYEHQTLTELSATEQHQYVSDALHRDRARPFAVHRQPLWRVRTYSLGSDYVSLSLTFSHAILDGWSVAAMLTELLDVYKRCQTAGAAPEPAALKSSYKHFVAEQLWLKEQTHVAAYWQRELDGYKRIGLDALLRDDQSSTFERAHYTRYDDISDELLAKLRERAAHAGTHLKAVCFAAYAYTLALFSYDNDITVGLIENGRPAREDGDAVLGCFLNTVPVRLAADPDMTWRHWLDKVHRKLADVAVYGRLSLREIMRCAGVQPSGEQPFSDALFNFTDFHVYEQVAAGEELEPEQGILPVEGYERNHAQLEFTVSATLNKMSLRIATRLGKRAALRLRAYYMRALEQLAADPDTKMTKLSLYPEHERVCLLEAYNRTSMAYDSHLSVVDQMLRQADRQPHAIAISNGAKTLTYRELMRRSAYAARLLMQAGTAPEQKVCVMMTRSIDWLVALVGVLRSGGCYIPVDPRFPAERVRYMLEDSDAAVLVTDRLTGAPADYAGVVLYMDELDWTGDRTDDLPPCDSDGTVRSGLTEEQLAYMIYTSGSTGQPKGVMIEHRSLTNFTAAMRHLLPFRTDQRVLAVTTCSFDIFALETLVPLCCGMEIVLAGEEEQADPRLLARLIDERRIDVVQLTPSRMQQLLLEPSGAAALSRLSALLLGGEALPAKLLDEARAAAPSARIFNLYGPTETTVWSAAQELTGEETVCIGTPVANTRVYIVDESMQLLPLGATGELCIAGDGLARGYWNKPEQTKSRFVSHPFERTGRLYRTGDLARWTAAGQLEYIGRADFQFKIRGHRIEPGEIEAALLEFPAIRDAVVAVVGDGAGARMQAYLAVEAPLDLPELKQQLRTVLPEYMVPGYFVQLDELPLTANGKTDRKALLALQQEGQTAERYHAPASQTEVWLATLWADVLERDQTTIGAQTSFFDAGGDSVTIVQLHSRIAAKYPGQLTVTELFAYPTIASLAAYLQEIAIGQAERYLPDRVSLPDSCFTRAATTVAADQASELISRELAGALLAGAQATQTEPLALLEAMLFYTLHLTSGEQTVAICRVTHDLSALPLTASFTGDDELGRIVGEIQAAQDRGPYVPLQHITPRIRTGADRSVSMAITDGAVGGEAIADLFDIVFTVQLTADGGRLAAVASHPYVRPGALEQLVAHYGQLIRHFMET